MHRIVYPVSTLSRTGPTSQLLNIVTHLDKSCFKPIILTLSPESGDSRFADFKAAGVEVSSLNMSRFNGLVRGHAAFRAHVRDLAPALIHSQGLRGDLLSAACGYSAPRIATIRNFPQNDYPMAYGLPGHILARVHMSAVRRLDCAVGVSLAVERNMRERFGLLKTSTILNGVDLSRFSKTDANHARQLRDRLGLPENARIWISAGTLSPRKAPMTLLRAWFDAFSDTHEQQLILLGDGPLMEECKEYVRDRKSVHLVGAVTNVSDYLQAADIFVSTSLAEGLPNAAIEAMACGLPVVLSDIEPHRELYGANPNIGHLFPVNERDKVSDILHAFSSIDLRSMSEAATLVARTSFSAEVMAASYKDLYIRLLKNASR